LFSFIFYLKFFIDQDEIELTLRDCCKYVLQHLCNECHCKYSLHKGHQKPRIPILTALCTPFDFLHGLLNYTKNSQKII
jgi:hypothetical protein